MSGQLVITVGGSGPSYQPVNQTQSGGSYTFSFQPSNLPTGQYSQVTAQWTVGGKTATGSRSVSFNVLGSYTHTQYNTPAESQCSGATGTAYLTTGPPFLSMVYSQFNKPVYKSSLAKRKWVHHWLRLDPRVPRRVQSAPWREPELLPTGEPGGPGL